MSDETDYDAEAKSDAKNMAEHFLDEIIEKLLDNGEASDDLNNDYPNGDSYHHESHVDKEYHLTDAAELLDQLKEHEETDTGLWEGQDPRQAIGTQAAYTYGAAVYCKWQEIIKEINDDDSVKALLEVYTALDGQETDLPEDFFKATMGSLKTSLEGVVEQVIKDY